MAFGVAARTISHGDPALDVDEPDDGQRQEQSDARDMVARDAMRLEGHAVSVVRS
jgi:hypothetical protein